MSDTNNAIAKHTMSVHSKRLFERGLVATGVPALARFFLALGMVVSSLGERRIGIDPAGTALTNGGDETAAALLESSTLGSLAPASSGASEEASAVSNMRRASSRR